MTTRKPKTAAQMTKRRPRTTYAHPNLVDSLSGNGLPAIATPDTPTYNGVLATLLRKRVKR